MKRIGRVVEGGFTLIELMIVLVVVAVLASVAYPSYSEYVVRTKRAEGKAALLDAAQSLERQFTNYNTYPSSLSAAGVRTHSGDSPGKAAYTLAIAAGTTGTLASSYVLTATPANGHVDPKCGNLSIDQLGRKGETGSLTVAECW
ncbi:MAG: type IV pilin protein [Burkholderiaceae bacterium]